MKTRARIISLLGTGIALATLSACGGGGGMVEYPDTPDYNAFVYRHSVMHLLENKTLIINDMYHEKRPVDEQLFVKTTQDMAALANMMLDGFQDKTIVPESRTKPEAFTNMDDFKLKANALIDGANALAEAAKSGGYAAAKPMIDAAVKSCGQCHRSYRAAEDDD
jgi:cytochrome c556